MGVALKTREDVTQLVLFVANRLAVRVQFVVGLDLPPLIFGPIAAKCRQLG